MPKFNAPLDMTLGEIRNAVTQNLSVAPGTTKPGLRYFDSTMNRERYWTGTAWLTIDIGWTTPTAPVDFGGQRIINLGTPTAATDAATKAYVDSVATGLDVKDSVRAASTGNVSVAAPGATLDGVTLVTGDRVLLKNQTTAAQNGIYIWTGPAAAMARAPDANTSTEVTSGMYTLVVAGTVHGSTGWVLSTPDPIVLDTTALSFSQISAPTVYVGTVNRITVTGNQIDIAATYVGQASITTVGTIGTGTWQGTAVGIAYGGTGATTAAGARTALGTTGKYTVLIGNGTASYDVTHSLNTLDVVVGIYENNSPFQDVYCDVTRVDVNTVRVAGFTTSPTAGTQLKVVVVG
jgi:hypothetical protein